MNLYTIINKMPSVALIEANNLDNDRVDSKFYHYKYLANEIKLVNSNIALSYLEGIIASMSSPIGWQGIPSSDYLPKGEGIPLIRVQNIGDAFLIQENLIDVKPHIYHEQPFIQVQPEDLIITRVGTIGRVCIAPSENKNYAMGQNLTKIRVKSDVDPYYVLIYLLSSSSYLQMERFAYGGVQPSLTNRNIKKIQIPIPSPEIQKYIGDKVRKAEKLRGEVQIMKNKSVGILNKYLEKPKISERSYSISLVERADLSNRIDAEFYGQEYLGTIKSLKAKYELISLEQICKGRIFNGKTYRTSSDWSSLQNIGVGELGDWFPKRNEDKGINEKVSAKNILPYGSIVWGNAAHLARYIGQKVNIILEGTRFVGTTEITSILPDESIMSPYFVFLFMNSDWGYYQIQRTVKGMTAHSYPDDIRNILLPVINFTQDELQEMKSNIINAHSALKYSQELIDSAISDIEDLIEGKFEIKKEYLNLI